MKKILDWNEYIAKASQTVAEGIVMLENKNGVLPLDKEKEVAVFGRIQLHYYKSGTGSGGMVNAPVVVGIIDGLRERGVKINEELFGIYKKWDEENPVERGSGWGEEPWAQHEMPLDEAVAEKISASTETAIVIIGRTAGEEMDNTNEKGGYLLTDAEENLMRIVRKNFPKMIVLLNVGGIIDMSFVDKYSPDSVLYVWQGGMTGGLGTADVLIGNIAPSGCLPDTIAYDIKDYPSDKFFGDRDKNCYSEDIYVGYRYFETFAKDKVRYPFGFGLTYTSFEYKNTSVEHDGNKLAVSTDVHNVGAYDGKSTVQFYLCAPEGRLGKPARVLCGFEKTDVISVGNSQNIAAEINIEDFASYDENTSTFVLEKGTYGLYMGCDVRSCEMIYSFTLDEDIVTNKVRQALAPIESFDRMVCRDGKPIFEKARTAEYDLKARIEEKLPNDIEYTGDKGIRPDDVMSGKNTMEKFIAQFSDKALSEIARGEGMGSPKVTAGTAAAFGGVTDELISLGLATGCCSDGPSGMRLDCGTSAFSLPNGTMIASTFNKTLITELFEFMGMEMVASHVDCLLGPGMNIHRHPLNGRNFEYFSEDPYLTGKMAAAELKGLHKHGVTGTIKHFCGNNQETNRHNLESVVSERALREIYLKGFEIAVKEGKAQTIMSTYGKVNGLWTCSHSDLCDEILRREWGFDGYVMTDWWANISGEDGNADKTNFAAMVKAHNDVYMVCADCENHDDNIMAELESGRLHRGELQRNAMNVCRMLFGTHAQKKDHDVEIINRPSEGNEIDGTKVKFYKIDGKTEIDLSGEDTSRGNTIPFGLDIADCGMYRVTITAKCEGSELAQIPVTLISMGSVSGSFVFNGGKEMSFEKDIPFFSRYTTLRLYFAQSGTKELKLGFEKLFDF